MIDRLQNYYGIAIRSNVGNVSEIKKAIYASLMHCASSKDCNLHCYCHEGADSWCRFRDIANGNKVVQTRSWAACSLPSLSQFTQISEDALLTRCLGGKTHIQNEATNGMNGTECQQMCLLWELILWSLEWMMLFPTRIWEVKQQ